MSRNDWEHGELILPRAAIVPIRRALIKRNNDEAEKALALAKKVWSEATAKQKKDPLYLSDRILAVGGNPPHYSYGPAAMRESNDTTTRATDILGAHAYRSDPRTRPPQKQNAGILGATTTEFSAGEADVTFDSASGKMTWSTGENNHAVERAHDTWLWETLRAELGKVQWTRGTGGWFTGNDEYNQESRDDGANYVTTAWGPVGAENHPMQTEPYTKSDGTRVTREALSVMQRDQWAKQARAEAKFARAMAGGATRRKTSAKSTAGSFASRVNDPPSGSLR